VVENGFRGQIDIDIFEIDGEYYFSEVNPRFGGGYPHAYACGADHMSLIRNNLMGKANLKNIGCYDIDKVMMKYNEIKIIDTV
jgi:carbamoyl-phosphate synthase large subunit